MFDQMGVASGMAGTFSFSCVSRFSCSNLAEQVQSLFSVEAEELERELVKAGFTQDHDMQKICLKEDSKASECVTMCKVYVFLPLDCHILRVCIRQENPTKAENGTSKKGQARVQR